MEFSDLFFQLCSSVLKTKWCESEGIEGTGVYLMFTVLKRRSFYHTHLLAGSAQCFLGFVNNKSQLHPLTGGMMINTWAALQCDVRRSSGCGGEIQSSGSASTGTAGTVSVRSVSDLRKHNILLHYFLSLMTYCIYTQRRRLCDGYNVSVRYTQGGQTQKKLGKMHHGKTKGVITQPEGVHLFVNRSTGWCLAVKSPWWHIHSSSEH